MFGNIVNYNIMRDAVSLIDKPISINECNYTIKDFYFVPHSKILYVKLHETTKNITVNYRYTDIHYYIVEQIKL